LDRFAIVGAGSLGQTFAGLLALNGHKVTLLATPSGARHLLQSKAIRLRGVFHYDVAVSQSEGLPNTVHVTTRAVDLPREVGLFFMTKGRQLPDAIAPVRAVWPAPDDDESWVAGVQNGLVKDDLLRDAFGARRLVGAVTIVGAQRDPDGCVQVTSRGATYLVEFTGKRSSRVTASTAALNAIGLPTDAVSDINQVLWSKACNAAGVFGVSVPTRASGQEMLRSAGLNRAYLALVRETAAIAAAYGVTLGDFAGFPIKTYLSRTDEDNVAARLASAASMRPGQGPDFYPSMTQDLLANRPMEVDAIFADLVRRADIMRVPVPRLTLIRDILQGLDPGQASP
jgi:2-dehydropantoate 2-reductase